MKVDYSGTFSISTKSNTVDVMKAEDFRNFVIEKFGENSLQANALGKTSTDWQDEIFRTAFSTDHNVSVSGAVPHMPYRVSVAYTNEMCIRDRYYRMFRHCSAFLIVLFL